MHAIICPYGATLYLTLTRPFCTKIVVFLSIDTYALVLCPPEVFLNGQCLIDASWHEPWTKGVCKIFDRSHAQVNDKAT